MKKRIGVCTLFMICTALMLGLFAFKNNQTINKAEAIDVIDSKITGVQMRSGGGNLNYLVILDDNIDSTQPLMSVSSKNYNAKDYINVYLSADGDAIPLSSFIDDRSWDINQWTSGGVMFPISEANYDIYNGKTVYAIEILQGCTYPSNNPNNMEKIQTIETVKYVNLHYGEEDVKVQSFDWTLALDPSGLEITLTSGQARADVENNFYFIALTSPTFDGVSPVLYSDLSLINAYSKIKLYLGKEDTTGHYLSEVTTLRSGYQNLWSSGAFLFALTASEFETYNGTALYKMTIEAGCQLLLNNQVVTVASSYSLVNSNYGDPDAKYGAFYFLPYIEPLSGPIQLIDAQVRADVGAQFFFIDVRSEIYTNTPVVAYDNLDSLNIYSHIKIYLSADDNGTLLSDVASLRSGYQNLWGSAAMLFSLTEQEYETYNGTSIYMIEVLEGCELFVNGMSGVVDKSYRFINGDYGNPAAKYEAFNFYMGSGALVDLGEINISSVHNRMDKEAGFRWIMLFVNEEIFDNQIDASSFIDQLNFMSGVSIYLDEDSAPITLADIYDPSGTGVTLDLFGERNMLGVSIINDKVDGQYQYCGPNMYKIEIAEGTQIPSYESGEMGYRTVSKKAIFVNNDYQKFGDIPGSVDEEGNPRKYEEWGINWRLEVDGLANLGEIGLIQLHNRMDKDSGYRWLMFFLDDSIYKVSLDVRSWVGELNLLDNVKIYLSDDANAEPLLLKDIYDVTATGVTLQLFGQKNMLAVSISNATSGETYKYCGPNMYKIVIEEGTQFPTYENGVAGYRVVTSKTVFINGDYQLSGDIPNTDDDGVPRIYEEWNVNWNMASCYATFTVVGIEGLSFPDMLLEYGQRVSLDIFAQDGYDLVVTTKTGERVYQCIIGSNRNYDFILTYSRSDKKEGKSSGCGGSIVASSSVLFIASIIGVTLLIKRRKENIA